MKKSSSSASSKSFASCLRMFSFEGKTSNQLQKKALFLVALIVCLTTFNAFAQQSLIVNPSFDVPAPCAPTANGTAPGWTNCANTPDILTGNGAVWCVNTPPQNGCSYAGICAGEFIGQKLACPFVAGRTYNMTVYLAWDNDYASTMALGACVKDRNKPGKFDIYGGATSCAATNLLWTSGLLTSAADTWQQYTISFTPTVTCDYIMFKNDVASSNVLIDNFQLQNSTTTTTIADATCSGPGNDGTATVIPPANGTNWNILWSNGQTTPTATGLSDGTYTVTLTDAQGFCTAPITLTVVVKGPPMVTATATPNTVCSGQNVQLNATVAVPPPVPCTYTINMFDSFGDGWGAGASLVVRVNGVTVGTYTCGTGSVASATFSVYSGDAITLTYTPPGSFATEASFELRNSSNAVVYTSGAGPTAGVKYSGAAACGSSTSTYTYSWSPTAGVSNANIKNPTLTASATTTYTCTVTASGNPTCPGKATTTVTVSNTTFSFTNANICSGGTAPAYPSTGAITGTWSPNTVSNTATTTYTFTPGAGQCATSATWTVTVGAGPPASVVTPAAFCQGGTAPVLPSPLADGTTGTWNPATINNTTIGTYTFTPTAGQCKTSASVTTSFSPNTAASVVTPAAFCQGATAPTLPSPLADGTTGTWNPATVSNSAVGTYTFTPNTGQCKTSASVTTSFSADVPASLTTPSPICPGGTAPTLPSPLADGTTGSWNPSTVSNAATANYTFTPNAGQCKSSAQITVTVSPASAVSLTTPAAICPGEPAPTLATPLPDGTTGSWNPSTVSNTATGNYTFTPTSGQCKTSASITVTVNPNVAVTLTTPAAICPGETAPTLATPLPDGTTGTWSPSTVSNTATGSYTFTPDPGQCKSSASITVTVKPAAAVTLTTPAAICPGETAPTLTTPLPDGTTGAWSPSSVSNTATGSYTFTPDPGQCKTSASITVTVNPDVPVTLVTPAAICSGDPAPTLANPADGTTGTWSPTTVSNTTTGSYTFTPDPGQCRTSASVTVTVNAKPTPTFNPIPPICAGDPTPTLQIPSNENINGAWNPSTVNNTSTATYTFTPNTGVCATTASITITVGPPQPATFTQIPAFCNGSTAPILKTVSDNGVSGSWAPPTVSNTASGTYVFTPNAGVCATTTDMTITVNPKQNPTFPTPAVYCKGDAIPALPVASNEGITGTWSPAIDNQNTTTYTFTPAASECANTTTTSITVNTPTTPLFTTPAAICAGGTAPTLPTPSSNGINGSWSPSPVDNMNTAVYTFTPTTGQCAETTTITVTINPGLTVSSSDVTTCANVGVQLNVTGGSAGATYSWTPAASLTGANTQTPTATVNTPTTYTVTVTDPTGCQGTTTATVSIAAGLSVSVTPSAPSICSGESVSLTASPAGATSYMWSPATGLSGTSGATVTATPTTTTTYTVDVNTNGCVGQATVVVTVGPPTQATFNPIPDFCSGTAAPTLPIVCNEGISGSWSPSNVSNTATGTYTFTPAAGACAIGTTMMITVNPTPTLGTVTPTCDGTNTNYTIVVNLVGGTTAFTVTPNAGSPGAPGIFTGNTWTSNPIPSGTAYNLDFVDAKTCGPVNVTGIKNCNCGTSVGTMSNTPLVLCQGASATATYTATGETLDANDAKEFVLHTNASGTLGTIITRSATPNFSFGAGMSFGTTYYISAIAGNNSGGGTVDITDPCLAVAIGQPVTWNATPIATASNNGPLCENGNLILTSTVTPTNPATTYSWTGPNAFTSALPNPTKNGVTSSDAGVYALTVTQNGCTSTATNTTLVVIPTPVATPSSNSPICAGATLNLTAQTIAGARYDWSGGLTSTQQNPSVNNAQTSNSGSYSLIVTVNGCPSAPVATNVTVNPTPVVAVNAPTTQTICQGTSTNPFVPTGAATYTWSPMTDLIVAGNGNATSTAQSNITYTVTGTSAGCSATATVNVVVNPTPVITPINNLPACEGSPMNVPAFTLTPAGGTTATAWSTTGAANVGLPSSGGPGNVPGFTAGGAGGNATINVTATRNGCPAVGESFVITVNKKPVVSINSNAPVCEGALLQFTAEPQGQPTYNWTTPSGNGSGNPLQYASASQANAGNYSVTVIDQNGCQGVATASATITVPSTPILGPNNAAYCKDNTTAVPLTANYTGTWSSPAGVSGSTFVPANGNVGLNTLTFTPATGICATTGTIDITVNAMPVIATPTGGTGCGPLSVTFTSFNAADLTTIAFGDGTSSNVANPTISNVYTNSGYYDVTVTQTTNGCKTSQTFDDIVYVEPNPVASFSAKNKLLYLTDPTAMFVNNTTGAVSYEWDFGDNVTSTINNPTHTYDEVAATYTITLTATSAAGCTDVTTQTIQIKDELLFFVPNTFTPDGDQHNNTFQPVFTSGFDPQNFTMYIFNRWGEIVFETHDANLGWDGTYKGEIVREGTYQWTMDVKDPGSDNKYNFHGHILLTR